MRDCKYLTIDTSQGLKLSFTLNGHITLICWNAYYGCISDIVYLYEDELGHFMELKGLTLKFSLKGYMTQGRIKCVIFIIISIVPIFHV
ncbi:hypothetical protein Lal_00033899 [Lupinus albus]|nr:hypothetical protein Lal_00033899 [Lupinus albus]